MNKLAYLLISLPLVVVISSCNTTGESASTYSYERLFQREPYYLAYKAQTDWTQHTLQFYRNDYPSVLNQYRGEGVRMVIIDTGIRYDHPAFTDENGNCRLSPLSAVVTGQGEMDTPTLTTVEEANGDYSILMEDVYDGSLRHGTSTAGLVFDAIDGKGGAGAAPNVELIYIKETHLYDMEFDAAIRYAASLEPDIVSMSLGYVLEDVIIDGEVVVEAYDHPEVFDILDLAFEELAKTDALVFASSGNEASKVPLYPASRDDVISVGAVDYEDDELTSFSNYGYNDIVASGFALAPYMEYLADGSVNPSSDGYGIVLGTSFSCPLVASAAAVYRSKFPKANKSQVKEALFSSAKDIGEDGYDELYGHGLLDLEALMEVVPNSN